MNINKKLLVTLLAVSSFSAIAQMGEMPPPAVTVEEISEISYTSNRRYVGSIGPITLVNFQPRVSGILEKANFTSGSMVKAGDLIFEIEDDIYKSNVATAKATLDQAIAEQTYAQDNYARKRMLVANEAGTQSEADDAKRLLDLANAQVDAAKAKLDVAELELSYTKLYSPIAGKIGKTTVSVGNYITPASAPLNNVVQIDPIYVTVSVSSKEFLNLVDKGRELNKHLNVQMLLANNEVYDANWRIEIVNNLADSQTDTIKIWLVVDNPKGKLLAGSYITINMQEKLDKPYAAVPLSAILNDAQGTYVYIVDDQNVASRRNITLGSSHEDRVIVNSGIAIGDKVITEGTHKIYAPNTKVNPIAKATK